MHSACSGSQREMPISEASSASSSRSSAPSSARSTPARPPPCSTFCMAVKGSGVFGSDWRREERPRTIFCMAVAAVSACSSMASGV